MESQVRRPSAGRKRTAEEPTVRNSADLYDAIYGFKDYAAEAEQVRALLEHHAERRVRSLLDVACGTGRHLELLAAHYAVEGLDLSDGMLAVARARLPGVSFHQGDMSAFDLGRRYDAIICLFGSIGYVRTLGRLRAAMQAMARHLLPGGVLLLEPFLSPESYRPATPYAVFVDRPDLKIARMSVGRLRGRRAILDFHYLVAEPAGVRHFTERHELALFTDAEYRAAIASAGLELQPEHRALTGRGLYVAVAR